MALPYVLPLTKKVFRSFNIKAIQSAGETSVAIDSEDQCIEIMTGAALDSTVDTVIRYEDITVDNGIQLLISISKRSEYPS